VVVQRSGQPPAGAWPEMSAPTVAAFQDPPIASASHVPAGSVILRSSRTDAFALGSGCSPRWWASTSTSGRRVENVVGVSGAPSPASRP
jgi:hypothetical protein